MVSGCLGINACVFIWKAENISSDILSCFSEVFRLVFGLEHGACLATEGTSVCALEIEWGQGTVQCSKVRLWWGPIPETGSFKQRQ